MLLTLVLLSTGTAAATEETIVLRIQSPCDTNEECSCPTDPQNYVFNIRGYVEECTKPM